MIIFLLIIASLLVIIFYKGKHAFEDKGVKKTALYYFYLYGLDFLVPFFFVALLYALIPVMILVSYENVNLQFLIDLEVFFLKIKDYFSFVKLSEWQILIIFLLVFVFGLLRMSVGKSKKVFSAIDKYRMLTRRIYIALVLLCSFTLFGTQMGAPTNDLRVRIKAIREGYADLEKKVEEVIFQEVSKEILIKIQESFPDSYKFALTIPVKIDTEFVSLQKIYDDGQDKYGFSSQKIEGIIENRSAKLETLKKVDSNVKYYDDRFVVIGGIYVLDAKDKKNKKIQSAKNVKSLSDFNAKYISENDWSKIKNDIYNKIDTKKIGKKEIEIANKAIINYKNSGSRERIIKLLNIEGGKQIVCQIPKVITSEMKMALLKPMFEAYPILEPIVDVFNNTLNKSIEKKVESSIDDLTKSIARHPDDAENSIRRYSSSLVKDVNINISEAVLKKALRSSQQLKSELNGVRAGRSEINSYINYARQWYSIKGEGSVMSYESYIKNNPKSPYIGEAKKVLNDVWEGLKKHNDLSKYQIFVQNNPNTALGNKAKMKIDNIFRSMSPSNTKYQINSNLSINVNWGAVQGAESYRVYWSNNRNNFNKKEKYESTNGTSFKHWPDRYPIYYRIVATRGDVMSKPSKVIKASLLSSKGGSACQICGASSIGYCHNRSIYVCSKHNYYTSKGGTYWRCP